MSDGEGTNPVNTWRQRRLLYGIGSVVWLVLAVAGATGGVVAPLVAVALFAGLGNAVVVARAQVMVRRVRNGPPAHSTQHKTIPLTTASVSVETPEARALELARRSRRIVRVAILYTLGLPLGVMVLDTWSVHTSDPDWVVLPIVVALGYLLILSILVLGARSGAKMVKETADALPDAYLVCRATDPQRSPVVITLIVQPAGVSLCRGRGAKIRPVWELAWADITAADVCEYTFKFDIRPAVRITCRDKRTKLLVLVDKKRRTSALMDFPRRVAALINEHALG